MNAKQAKDHFEKLSGVRPVGRGYLASEQVQGEVAALGALVAANDAARARGLSGEALALAYRQNDLAHLRALDALDKGGREKRRLKVLAELGFDV
jgi:hypothetical protein